jgi:steroid delta-isomerase-like uncharacterized protein
MAHDNVALVRRWFDEVWNQRRAATIHELLTSESICFAEEGPIRGPEEFTQRMHTPFLAAFPDLRVDVEASLSQGDQVVVRWTAEGAHTGDGLGVPPTGKPVSFRGITWIRLHDAKFVEGWQSSNIPEVLGGLRPKA